MKYSIYIVALLMLVSGVVSFAQQQDNEVKTEIEEAQEKDAEKIDEALQKTPPPPKPSNKSFKPSTEISDDSPVAFPVDI